MLVQSAIWISLTLQQNCLVSLTTAEQKKICFFDKRFQIVFFFKKKRSILGCQSLEMKGKTSLFRRFSHSSIQPFSFFFSLTIFKFQTCVARKKIATDVFQSTGSEWNLFIYFIITQALFLKKQQNQTKNAFSKFQQADFELA